MTDHRKKFTAVLEDVSAVVARAKLGLGEEPTEGTARIEHVCGPIRHRIGVVQSSLGYQSPNIMIGEAFLVVSFDWGSMERAIVCVCLTREAAESELLMLDSDATRHRALRSMFDAWLRDNPPPKQKPWSGAGVPPRGAVEEQVRQFHQAYQQWEVDRDAARFRLFSTYTGFLPVDRPAPEYRTVPVDLRGPVP